jgi:hypothetical protein
MAKVQIPDLPQKDTTQTHENLRFMPWGTSTAHWSSVSKPTLCVAAALCTLMLDLSLREAKSKICAEVSAQLRNSAIQGANCRVNAQEPLV